MRMASLFSGIGGFELAAQRVGITPVWASEIEPFPLKVHAARFPNMTQYGDVSQIDGTQTPPVDLITAGSPCQGFSVAGLRQGLADERSGLFGEFVRLVEETGSEWAIWENVPNALSTNEGKDFENVIAALVGSTAPVRLPRGRARRAGFVAGRTASVAWRVLDAQYFGVPQRRERVFAIRRARGYCECPKQILFERGGRERDSQTATGKGVQSASVPESAPDRCYWNGSQVTDTLDLSKLGKGQTLPEKGRFPYVLDGGRLRRITPLESERCFGFPDGWTNIPGASDTGRYKALGNSIAVPVAEWILSRLLSVSQECEH